MKNIILIQPETEAFDSYKSGLTPPLSLLSASRYVAKKYNIILIDMRKNYKWQNQLKDALEKKPVLVGITSVTGKQLLSAIKACRFVKQHSIVPLVWGGIHATLLTNQLLAEHFIDFIITGEGESAFLKLADAIHDGLNLKDKQTKIPNVFFKCKNSLSGIKSDSFLNLDNIPHLPYSILKSNYGFFYKGRPAFYFETSRGCPHRCSYCYNSVFHKSKWRAMSPEKVLEEVKILLYHFPNIKHLSIIDDNYLVSKKRALKIAELLLKNNIELSYQLQGVNVSSIYKLNHQELKLLSKSGLVRIDMGIETASKDILKKVNKKINIDEVINVNLKMANYGITCWFNFMSGFPWESEKDLYKSIDLIFKLTKDNKNTLISPVYCLAPYPGTELFESQIKIQDTLPVHTAKWADFSLDTPSIDANNHNLHNNLKSLYFLSIFIDNKVQTYGTAKTIKLLASMYRPLARWRIKYKLFNFVPELQLFNIFTK